MKGGLKMAEYLEKQAVIEAFNMAFANNTLLSHTLIAVSEEIIDKAEAADVQPVKHGKWDFQGYQLFKCTNCTKIYTQEQLEDIGENWTFPNFCPNCGADMREQLE